MVISMERKREGTMSKIPVLVTLGREVQLTAPGMLGRKFDFNPGYAFFTQEWFFPGEPTEKGALAGRTSDQWSFGTNTGTDLPLTFRGEDIREVVIPNDPETVLLYTNTPFKVTINN
jgi:hypothetical protein